MNEFKRVLIELEVADFNSDNPGGEWLQEKQKYADKNPRLRGLTGATTGYFDRTLKLPTHIVNNLPGASGEHKFRDSSLKLKRLEEEIGHPSQFDTSKDPILIGVNHHGHAHILEGNHRTAYAAKHNIPHIHAEVRYYNGGEGVKHNFSPDKISSYEVAMIKTLLASEAVKVKKQTPRLARISHNYMGEPYTRIAINPTKEHFDYILNRANQIHKNAKKNGIKIIQRNLFLNMQKMKE